MRYMLRPSLKLDLSGEPDQLFDQAVEVVIQYDRASPALLQRRLSIGYARASRLLDQLQTAGVVGPPEGAKPREVLIRSYKGYLEKKGEGKKPETQEEQEEDVFKVPENYRVPKDVKLTRVDKPEWGRQLGDVVNSDEFKKASVDYPIVLGFDEEDKLQVTSLSDLGNLIVIGNPLSKKDNFIDTVLTTLLLKRSPEDLRFILVDTSHYLDFYNGISHLLTPVTTEYQEDISAYRWTMEEIDRRMKLFVQASVRALILTTD